MAHFIVEDGTGLDDANALITTDEADEIISNYGNSVDWSGASPTTKKNAIRVATRFMDYNYQWKGYKTYSTQALQWPRLYMTDEDDNEIESDIIPEKVKEACATLALKVVEGTTLLEDVESSSMVKRKKEIVGPITEETEYVSGEAPGTTFQVADRLVKFYVLNKYRGKDLERA